MVLFSSDRIDVSSDDDILVSPIGVSSDGLTIYRLKGELKLRLHDKDLTIFIPVGIDTDFGTIPKPFCLAIASDDYRIILPAIIHDVFIYLEIFNDKPWADKLFVHMCRKRKVGFLLSWVMYFFVSKFGRPYSVVRDSRLERSARSLMLLRNPILKGMITSD